MREAALLLDIPVELRPCPGARAGFAAELKQRTGRMTARALRTLTLPRTLTLTITQTPTPTPQRQP